MTTDITSKLYDPNGELTEDELEYALRTATCAFRDCHIEPQLAAGYPCKTLLLGKIGSKKYLVYVRVTRKEDEENGTGPMPLVLIDACHSFEAEPCVLRVNITKIESGIGFKYWGIKELEDEIKSNTEEWRRLLLRGKSITDFIRLLHGKISRIELKLDVKPPDARRTLSFVSAQLRVDGTEIACPDIDIVQLAQSCYRNDEFWIFTCSCGEPFCADINNPVTVAHENGVTIWKAYSLKPARVWSFDQGQYAAEIRKILREFTHTLKAFDPETASDAYFHTYPEIEAALFEIDETTE